MIERFRRWLGGYLVARAWRSAAREMEKAKRENR